jgi:type VI secretion system protein ImpL
MKQTLWKILKIALLVFASLLLIGIVVGIVLSMGWSWWVSVFILLGLLGLAIGFVLLRKIWLRRVEQRFVQQVIAQDEAHRNTLGEKEKSGSKELQDRWKEAVTALRKSHLKEYGNPLYVLPWYMIIGESGSGKTTAIESARLSSPFVETRRTSGISGTRDCDWWFFEQAILLDTAGRYTIPVDEGRDRDEWQKFMKLLAKFRKKEPINGLVVTIATDKLTSSGPDELREDGHNIRRRIDELMRVLGAKFPVYILVTKCDLIQGMTTFCDNLSEVTQSQAMGMINQDLSTDIESFTALAINTLTERLKDLRLLLFHQSRSKATDPGLLLFPEEFKRLKTGLSTFMKETFQETPYQETPILRGLFFSSGKQEGSPYSHFLKELGMIDEREVLPGTNKGLFLHDFFSRIMPADRKLFAPTQRMLAWERLTQNLGLTAWLAVTIALCGLLSFAFAKNLFIMREVSREVSKPVVLQNELIADVIGMDRFRQAILRVEQQNEGWWIPRFGLSESINVEQELKTKYSKQFLESLLLRYNDKIAKAMAHFSSGTPEELVGAHVAQLVRRINLLRARLENQTLESITVRPLRSYEYTLRTPGQDVIPEVGRKFSDLYLYYVFWHEDTSGLNHEMNELRLLLNHALTLKNADLKWIVTWINLDPELSYVALEDFWGGSQAAKDDRKVAPAFTLMGKAKIDSFIKEMESALVDPLIVAAKKLEFQTWYCEAYFNAWHEFGFAFHQGSELLKGEAEWQQVAARMGSDQNPYFALFDRISKEMKPFSEQQEVPSWLKLVYDFKDAEREAAYIKKRSGEKPGIIKAATRKMKSKIAGIKKQSGIKAGDLEYELAASQALRDYQDSLAENVPVSASRETAYETAAAIYKDDPATSKIPFYAGLRALNQMKTAMAGGGPDQKLFWTLAQGPLDYFLEFVSREAACKLQKIWETDVLLEVQGAPDKNTLMKLLLDQDGYARKFISEPAKPFIARSLKKGFYAKEIMGHSVPFDSYFFSFLTKGSRSARPAAAHYTVIIKSEPTGANKDASVKPHATSLEMQCADKTLQLINLNYPIRKTFTWSPDTCGDVVFKINIGNLTLTKEYAGHLAFAKFIKDFEKGTRTFYPRDFPDQAADLKRMGIRHITTQYRFTGHRPVLGLFYTGPGRVPEKIAMCWDQ